MPRRWFIHRACQIRKQSTSASSSSKAYTATMLLPKTAFPQWAEAEAREAPFRERTSGELYRWQAANLRGKPFLLHDGPPYANGHLHMGHALNKILKDIINRFQVLQGRPVHFVPGWDCHGLPIENKALQELGAAAKEVSPGELRRVARTVAERDMEIQKEEFKQFGIMADWSKESTYRTMDHDYEMRQLRVLRELVARGLIYRQHKPVHWSPSSKSALAEAELEYVDNHKSFPVYVKFRVEPKGMPTTLRETVVKAGLNPDSDPIHLAIWTTTPWTLPANMAIAVNPDLDYLLVRRALHPSEGALIVVRDRLMLLQKALGEMDVMETIKGSGLLDTPYTHMFMPKTAAPLKVIPWNQVAAETGTGLVHLAPGHGRDDYLVLKALGLLDQIPIACPVDEEGLYSPEIRSTCRDAAVGERLAGKPVLGEGAKAIVTILQEANLLLAQEKLRHKYPYDWKTKQPIIVRATSQWFANVDQIKAAATKALQAVEFQPSVSRSRLEAFIRERSEWCISRQRSWGVPIPALYDAETGEAVLTPESLDYIIPVLEKHGIDHWFDGPVSDFVPPALRRDGRTYVKGTDTVDVWFDSGTSWSSLPGRSADVCLEGSDQHRGWFQSLLLTAIGSGQSVAPYATLITHGFVLDDKGTKMSKSIGNVISPIGIIQGGQDKKRDPAHGADILRLWAASVDYGRDVSIGPKMLSQSAEAYRKIRNTVRFLLANLRDAEAIVPSSAPFPKAGMSIADRYVMHQLYHVEIACKQAYLEYDFPRVVSIVNRFITSTLSSFYFDVTKDTLYADAESHPGRRAVIYVMHQVLDILPKLVGPILPHLAEEVHEVLKVTGHPQSAFGAGWKNVSDDWNDFDVERSMSLLLKAKSEVLSLLEGARKDKLIGGSLDSSLRITLPVDYSPNALADILRQEHEFLKTFFVVSSVETVENSKFDEADLRPGQSRSIPNDGGSGEVSFQVTRPVHEKCPRCWQHSKLEVDDLCVRCTGVVRDSGLSFVEKMDSIL